MSPFKPLWSVMPDSLTLKRGDEPLLDLRIELRPGEDRTPEQLRAIADQLAAQLNRSERVATEAETEAEEISISGSFRKRADAIADALRSLAEDMQSQFDERSERWQEGEKGEAFSSIIEEVGQAQDTIESIDWES